MSYVIQNFSQFSKLVTITPRFRFLIILKNINHILAFLKINTFLYSLARFYKNRAGYFLLFYKYFYFSQLSKLFYNVNLSLSGNYTNNLKKSTIFFNFKALDSFFSKQKINPKRIACLNEINYNLYFISIKLANFQANNKFYRSAFFYLLLGLPGLWYAHTAFFRFYLNFFFVPYTAKIFKFYNGRFFKVYNF